MIGKSLKIMTEQKIIVCEQPKKSETEQKEEGEVLGDISSSDESRRHRHMNIT